MVFSKHLSMDHSLKLMIITQIVIVFVVDIVISADCSKIGRDVPTFKNCQYRCHCTNDAACDENTGECRNGCEFGWMGPGCQYRNIAKLILYGKRSGWSKYHALKAVDGNLRTCSNISTTADSGQQYWYITFNEIHEVLGLIIKVPSEDVDNFRMFSITTGNQSDEVNFPTLCYRHTNSSIEQNMEVLCNKTMKIKQLKIMLNKPNVPLRLCEVEIYGGRSVTFNKPTIQKSTYMDWNASRAVDGLIPTFRDSDYKCAATKYALDPWWRVDLETQFVLHDIQFYGRLGWGHKYQFRGFYLNYGTDRDAMIRLYHDTSPSNVSYLAYAPMNIPVSPHVTGQYLQIKFTNMTHGERPPGTALLAVCEVLAFAECPKDKCGWDCSKSCHCSTDITGSYKIEGTCPYGCSGRWTGVNNKCNHECNSSKWGTRCEKTCDHCSGNKTCDVISGACMNESFGLQMPPMRTKGCDKWTMVAIVGGPAGAMIIVLILTIIVLMYRQEMSKRREMNCTIPASDERTYDQIDRETELSCEDRTYSGLY